MYKRNLLQAVLLLEQTLEVMPNKKDVRVTLEFSDGNSGMTERVSGYVKEVKKHLIIITVPDVQKYAKNERTKATVLVQPAARIEGPDSAGTALSIVFSPKEQSISNSRKRPATASLEQVLT